MSEQTAFVVHRVVNPEHRSGCPCFACGEWRAAVRSVITDRRKWPVPARDWRGEVLQ